VVGDAGIVQPQQHSREHGEEGQRQTPATRAKSGRFKKMR
jgi:hypothetical protein